MPKVVMFKALLDVGNGKLVSSGVYDDREIEYSTTEETACMHMFIFRDLKKAKEYAAGINDIWAVEVDEEDTQPAPSKILEVHLIDEHFDEFWSDPQTFARRNPNAMQQTPKGSYNCNRLRVLERVY